MKRGRALSTFLPLTAAIMIMALSPTSPVAAIPLPDVEATAAASCFEFAYATPFRMSVGKYPMQIRLGDFNEDGTKDFAIADPSAHQIWIGIGLSDGTFGTPVGYPQNSAWMLAIADFNGDGHQDVAVPNREVAGSTTGGVSLLLGTGQGTFTARTVITVPTSVPTLAAADFNRDGRTDLALCEGSGRVELFLGNGDGTFRAGNSYAGVGTNLYNPAVGDFNGDGRPDLAVPGWNGTLAVLIANADGAFAPAVLYSLGHNPVNVAVGDFNADSRQDLAVATYGTLDLSVLLGNGNGTFGTATEYFAGYNVREIALGDFNADGAQDLAIANYGDPFISILTGRGDGTFNWRMNFTVSTGAGSPSLVVHDFNRDGRQDLAVTSAVWPDRAHEVSILLNICGPMIEFLSPAGGSVDGGERVAIFGRNLDGATSVRFDGISVPFVGYGGTFISATAPQHVAGAVDVSVTTGVGSQTKKNGYTFTHPPAVEDQAFSIREDAAPSSVVGTVSASDPDPGTTLSFSLSGNGAERFSIGWNSGQIQVVSKLNFETAPSYTLQVRVSDGFLADTANVTITVVDVVEPPVLNAITPAFGPASGGKAARITGANLAAVTAVSFGGAAAVLGARTDHSIALTTPAHLPGLVDVVVTSPSGSSTLARAYNYTQATSTCLNLRQSGVYPAPYGSSAAVADFNGDGRQDVAVAGSDGSLRAMLAAEDGSFTTSWNGWIEGGEIGVVAADLNRDGRQDLVVGSDFQWLALLGDGSGSFAESWNESWYGAGIPLAGDLDGDGLIDVALLDRQMFGEVIIRPGAGDGTFSAFQWASVWVPYYRGAAAADFDGDGQLDLAITSDFSIDLHLGVGGGFFQYARSVPVAEYPAHTATGDLNGDGHLDLVTSHPGSALVSVNLNAGDGTFTLRSFAAASPGALTIADFDNDGFQDLAIANQAAQNVGILAGDGSGNFTHALSIAAGTVAARIATGDLNGDGRYDLVLLDQVASRAVVFSSNCGITISAVTPAIGSARGGRTVTISGSELEGAATVTFGGAPATVTANTATSITVVTPVHAAGKVDVVVTTAKGTATASNAYTFDAPPVVNPSTLSVTPATVALGATIAATAEFTDPDGAGVTHAGTIDWGDGTSVAAVVTEPSGTDAGRAVGSHTYAATGVYTVRFEVSDASDSGTASFRYAIVVDPAGAFITGGGTIDSPAGAYGPDPALTGKASFAFTMKYLKNQAAPQGEADFHFQNASLKFKARVNEWLVVAGSKAQFRVTGTIDGSGSYGCLMTAIDGKTAGADKLRIKIWDLITGTVLYDNVRGAAGDLSIDPPAIAGGSINIH